MIANLGTRLGEYFYKLGYIEENEVDAVRYYVEVFFNEYLQLCLTLIIGYVMGLLLETLFYLVVFVALRKYSGGYHAKTILMCNVISYTLYFCAFYLYRYMSFEMSIFTMLVSSVYLFVKGPIYSCNQKEYQHLSKQNIKLRTNLVILILSTLILFKFQYVALLSLTIMEVMLLNIVKERSELNGNC